MSQKKRVQAVTAHNGHTDNKTNVKFAHKMAIKLKTEITQSFPSCSSVKFCDTTAPYSSENTGGYGSPNPARTDITKTKIYVMNPASETFVEIVTDFLPTDDCVTLTTADLIDSGATVTDNLDCCDCPKTPTTEAIGAWNDGCWEWKYEIYAAGNCYAYDVSEIDFPNAFRITINSTLYVAGYATSKSDLVIKLNAINLGFFSLSGDTISVCSTNVYENLEWANAVFTDNDAVISYPRQTIAYINSVMYDLGLVVSSANQLAQLNALNLGTFNTTTADFIAFGFNNYGDEAYGILYYDNTVFTYPSATSSITIDGAVYTLGAASSVTQLVANLNLLNLGLFSYNSTTHRINCTSTHTLTALTVGATTTANPNGGLNGYQTVVSDSGAVSPNQ